MPLTNTAPQGRQAVAIANDITFQSGAFGPREDALFKAATELALEERLPVVYLAANSGKVFGLTDCWRCAFVLTVLVVVSSWCPGRPGSRLSRLRCLPFVPSPPVRSCLPLLHAQQLHSR